MFLLLWWLYIPLRFVPWLYIMSQTLTQIMTSPLLHTIQITQYTLFTHSDVWPSINCSIFVTKYRGVSLEIYLTISAHLRDYIKLWYPICTENQLEFITFAICCNFCICTFIKWLFIIGKSILMHTNNTPSIKHRIKVYAWDYNFSSLYHNR